MQSTRTRDAFIAAVGAITVLFLAMYLPNGLPKIALAVGVTVFLLYLFIVPRFWYRRIVSGVLVLWAGAIAVPGFLVEAQLPDDSAFRFLVEGSGWALHVPLCLAFIAALIASLVHERMQNPSSNGAFIHVDSDQVAGDKVMRDKSVQEAGRDIYATEGPLEIHHHYGDAEAEKRLTSNHHQISDPTRDFVGREDEIAQALAAFEGMAQGAVIVGARGMGGVGKTELAKELAKRLRDRFPNGQIFFNLHGASDDDSIPEVTAADAMSHVIQSFHPEAKLPEGVESLRGIYLSALEGKRVLLLMDNAPSDAKVLRPLTPPPKGCALMVTSRYHIDLHGLESVDIDTLPPEKARELLQEICPRIGDDAGALAERCGNLPLALRLAASALKTRPTLDVPDYIERLSAEKGRLAMLDQYQDSTEEERGVEASLAISYNLLDKDLQRFWRALSVFPGDFDSEAASAVGLLPEGQDTETALSELHAASMMPWDENTKRFRLHDLARDYAHDRLNEEERVEAGLRHATHYLAELGRADEIYLEGGDSILRGLTLFDREWENIAAGQAWAAARGNEDAAARLCSAYPNAGVFCLSLRLHSRDQIAWIEAAVDASRTMMERGAEGCHLTNLGLAYARLGELAKAIGYHEQALVISREVGDRRLEGNTLGNLGNSYADLGETSKAIEHYEQRVVIAREIGDRRGEGNVLGNLGNAYTVLGEKAKAIEHQEQALAISREIGDRCAEGQDLANLGNAHAALGETSNAIEHYEQALAISREIGDRRIEGITSHNLANELSKAGRVDEAIAYAENAVAILEAIESPHAANARALLEKLRRERE